MRNLHLVSCGIAVLALAPGATGQAPVIQSGGVQNAASNVSLTSTSPQMLVTIKGQNLATSTEAASGFPWPVTLGGASVTFNGKPATLFYASPTQIDAQVPSGLNALAHSNALPEIVVSTAAGSSAPYPLPQVNSGLDLGIFTQATSGCGQAVAYTVHSDGKGTIEEMARAAEALGFAYLTLTDHSPAASYALSRLAAGDEAGFHDVLGPTVPLSRHIFKAPTRFYKTGIVFMAYLNGHQDHFTMVGGQESTRSTLHLAELFRLADQAGLLANPEMATRRMKAVLVLRGVEV